MDIIQAEEPGLFCGRRRRWRWTADCGPAVSWGEAVQIHTLNFTGLQTQYYSSKVSLVCEGVPVSESGVSLSATGPTPAPPPQEPRTITMIWWQLSKSRSNRTKKSWDLWLILKLSGSHTGGSRVTAGGCLGISCRRYLLLTYIWKIPTTSLNIFTCK